MFMGEEREQEQFNVKTILLLCDGDVFNNYHM